MTVPNNLTKVLYGGNDATINFPYTFKIFKSSDLRVIYTNSDNVEIVLNEGVDYDVNGAGGEFGGSVDYPLVGDPLAIGDKITLWRVVEITQETDIANQSGLNPEVIEDALDKEVMIAQNQDEEINRTLKYPVSDDSGFNVELPVAEAGKVLQYNEAGTAFKNVDIGSIALATPGDGTVSAIKIDATDIVAIRGVLEVDSSAEANAKFVGVGGDTMTGDLVMSGASIDHAKGGDLASAATVNIGVATGNYLDVTGVITITAFDTVQAGITRIVRFTGILTLTHHNTSLILPTSTNILTAVGDTATFVSLGAGNWKCVNYQRANGSPLAVNAIQVVAGDILVHQNDTLRDTPNASYTKLKETNLGQYIGELRIKFTMTYVGGAGDTLYAKIYRNGSPVGTEQSITTGSTEFSEDIAGWSADDTIQVYGYTDGTVDCDISDFRIFADKTLQPTTAIGF